jgi:hypothetical protein
MHGEPRRPRDPNQPAKLIVDIATGEHPHDDPDEGKDPAPVALHFQHYNLASPHKNLKNPYPRTSAIAAGVSDHIWTLTEIAGLLD